MRSIHVSVGAVQGASVGVFVIRRVARAWPAGERRHWASRQARLGECQNTSLFLEAIRCAGGERYQRRRLRRRVGSMCNRHRKRIMSRDTLSWRELCGLLNK